MKRLYQVTAEVISYVVAETPFEARRVIERMLNHDVGEWDVTPSPVSNKDEIDLAWEGCVPWGESEDKEVEDWIPEEEKEEEK